MKIAGLKRSTAVASDRFDSSLRCPMHRPRCVSPTSTPTFSSTSSFSSIPARPFSSTPSSRSFVCFSHDRQRSAPTEGNLSAGRPPRHNPIEPPTKIARGNKGSGGDSSASRLPPHVPRGEVTSPSKTLLEAEEAAALASSVASTDLQFATTLVKSLEASASQRADEIAAAAAADFETVFYRRKLALAEGNGTNHNLKKTLTDAAEHRRGQLRQLRHALRGDIQALVREGKASKDEAAKADAAVESAFKRASSALEEAAAAASARAAKLAG